MQILNLSNFSLSHALKFHKHKSEFFELHDNLGKDPTNLLDAEYRS
ncbi:hypothetical protein EBME_0292 [bacterium endosymbiont of Mortierella elongata FMR23-6]|nr:hypothetical protein EBME_0292 [bacterium endosymbiont of Mortierella elongata FMR23-6]